MATARVLREGWSEGRAALGLWAALPSAFAAELMALEGVAYVCVDQQHGLIDYADLVEMTRAIEGRGVVPITRVPANQAWMIGKALDAGSQGVVVPLVNTGADAAAAVAACRYPPDGVRSFGPIRATLSMNARDTATLGGDPVCFVMVETREGLANIDAIAATPGLDGVYIGPADLALGLGLPPDLDKEEPEHVLAVERIRAACERNGIIAGIQCGSGRAAHMYVERGFRLVTFGKDSAFLQSGVQRELAIARGADVAVAAAAPQQGYT